MPASPTIENSGVARRCRCGAPAPRVRVVQERLKSIIPIGIVYEHSCAACGLTFNVHSVTAVLFASFAAAFLTAAGALVTLHPPGSAVGAADTNRWFGVGLLVIGLLTWIVPVARIVGRARHRVVRPQ
jgi:hypothetical protein